MNPDHLTAITDACPHCGQAGVITWRRPVHVEPGEDLPPGTPLDPADVDAALRAGLVVNASAPMHLPDCPAR